ncbi:MAG: hypothetical protein LUE86_08030, partial [Clostridiales bacterium]|nr:hypothetical protein [Clostridiales bacterium]
AGIAVIVNISGMDHEIRVVTDGERMTAYSNTEKDMYQVLSWNDEYLSMAIESSPVDFDSAIKIMRTRTVTRLVELNAAENLETAEKMYDDASSDDPDKDTRTLSVCSCYETSIRYGDGYEERYEIVACPKGEQKGE